MKNLNAVRKLTAVAVLLSFLAVPTVAALERGREPGQPPALVRIINAAKRILGITTTGDFPTVPKP
ncbi:MAG TPA: hypothetical protein VJZ00_22440 [Thermoanaerobaculia bacterium]|nr:hypothetical protein [Thermoanaerobaculia bacterium]